jgi:SPW repeat
MRWQDWIMAALGVSLFSAPFVFDATLSVSAALTAWVGGALLVAFGGGSLIARWESSIELLPLVECVLLFVSPWLFGFTSVTTIATSVWIISAVAFIVSSAALRHGDAVTGV